MDAIRTLNNTVKMPTIGFGTYLLKDGEPAYKAVGAALKAGYRHIDTAAYYGNEHSVGKAIRDSGLAREEVFVTTKLWTDAIRGGNACEAFEKSLRLLGCGYVDLYLIHWPADGFAEAWLALEELYGSGAIKAIGVSNFQPHHLETLMHKATVTPAVNQIECHPYLTQNELREYCAKRLIQCESWSPFGGKGGALLADRTIQAIAEKHGKSPAQIVLRWNVQLGLSVNPKTEHEQRMRENLDVFTFSLGADDMRSLSELSRGKRFGPDPDTFSF